MSSRPATSPRLVVLCQCDQLRPFELGCYGHPIVRTPNIDRLASEGTRFELAVTNNPVCVPARSALISGRFSRSCAGSLENAYADRGPVDDRTRLPDATLPEVLRECGYTNSLVGKWHMYPHPSSLGFDDCVYPKVEHRYRGQRYFEGDDAEGFIVESSGPEYEIGRLADRISEIASDPEEQPAFIYWNVSLPHQPLMEGVPDAVWSRYAPDEAVIRPNAIDDGTPSHSDFWFRVYLYVDYFWEWLAWKRGQAGEVDESRYPLPRDDFGLADLYAMYYGAVSYVDELVGKGLALLEEHGLSDDTLFVFLSDHGDNLGSHGLFNKGALIEEAYRVPLIIRGPGVRRGAVNRRQVAQTVDLMPTILNAVGATVPDHAQGRSLLPVLRGDAEALSEVFGIVETQRHEVGMRTPDALCGIMLDSTNRRIERAPSCYFDLASDPFQLSNLVAEGVPGGELGKQVSSMTECLADWHRDTPWLEVAGSAVD